MDHRHLTFIIVPHADLETRTFTVSYARMKALLVGVAGLLLIFVVVVSTWWYVAAQAARAASLERDVRRLESERAKVTRLAQELEQVESQYEHVRQLLGADAPAARGKDPILPPIGRKSAPPAPTSAGAGSGRSTTKAETAAKAEPRPATPASPAAGGPPTPDTAPRIGLDK